MNDVNYLCCGLLVLAVIFSFPLFGGGGHSTSNSEKAETGYLIRYRYPGRGRKLYSEGYPLYVNEATVHKALCTGDYYIDEHDTREIPVGQQYTDERLNK